MATNPTSTRVARSWTDNQTTQSYKWTIVFWLSLVLAILISVYIWFVWPRESAKTFVTTIAVSDYGRRLPTLHYAVWDTQALIQKMDKRGLRKWIEVPSEVSASADAVLEIVKRLRDRMLEKDVESKDTIVIQLRGHARVGKRPEQLMLMCGESERNDDSSVGQVPIADLLTDFQKLPAANIIVVADICDLDCAPQIGLMVNPISTALQEICATLPKIPNRNLWVICAKHEHQTTLVSHLRKRTLLQSACEFALDPKSIDINSSRPAELTLAQVYDRIVRYSHTASNGRQVPMLLCAGAPTSISKSGTERYWALARQVLVAHLADNYSVSKLRDKQKDEKKESNSDSPDDGSVNKVSYQPPSSAATANQPQPNPTAPNAANGNPNGAINPQANAGNAPPAAATPLDPALQFWKLREELETTHAWSPNQFAPQLWHQFQWHYLLQQYASNSLTSSSSREALDEFKKLKELVASNNLGQDVSAFRLASAYSDFQRDPKIMRGPWENPELLPRGEQARWQDLRNNYHAYADACSSFSDWALWARHDLSCVSQASELVDALVAARRTLPNERAILAQEPSLSLDASRIQSAIAALASAVQTQARAMIALLDEKKVQLSWSEEHQLYALLGSPVVDFETRQRLWSGFRKLTANNVKEIELSTEQINRGDLDKLLSVTSIDPRLSEWFAVLGNSLRLVDVTQPLSRPASLEEMTSWGVDFSNRVKQSKAPIDTPQANRLHDWHVACLQTLIIPPPSQMPDLQPGIVLPASLSSALSLAVAGSEPTAFRSQKQFTLTLSVRRSDGTPVDACFVTWRFANPGAITASKLTPAQCLKITTLDAAPVTLSDKPQRVAVNNMTMRLNCSTEIDSTRFKQPLSVVFELREATASGSGLESQQLAIDIQPPQPDVVELVTDQLLGGKVTRIEPNGENSVTTLTTKAIKKASTRYQFSLRNLSSEPKRCQAVVYSLPASIVPPAVVFSSDFDKARLDDELRIQIATRKPTFTSTAVNLTAATLAASPTVALKLRADADAASPPPAPANGSAERDEPQWLYFVIQELDAEDKPKKKAPTTALCELKGLSPTDSNDILSITPVLPLIPDGFKLKLEPRSDSWAMYGHEELAIKAEVTDDNGQSIDVPGAAHNFTPGSGPFELRVQQNPARPKISNMVVHLSVGEYPRAIAYSIADGEPRPYPGAFAWVDSIKGIPSNRPGLIDPDPYDRDPSPDKDQTDWIFKMKDNDGDIEYQGIQVKARVDVPAHGAPATFALFSASNAELISAGRRFEIDRQFRYQTAAQPDGSVAVSATASDVTARLDGEMQGRISMQVRFTYVPGDRSSDAVIRRNLIFDRDPPEPVDIVPSGREIAAGRPFQVRIKPRDALSGIRKVYLAIDGPGAEENVYDEGDQKIEGNDDNGEWVFVIEAEPLIKSGRNSIKLVAMSEDKAGNKQKGHPLRRLPISRVVIPDAKAK